MTTSDHDTTGIPADPYADEARRRWGHTDAYRQSQERVKKLSKDDFARIGRESEELTRQLAELSGCDPADPAVQALIARHYAGLRHFYEPNLELYRGLADMYVADERFAVHYDKYKPGLALFMRDAMHAFCKAQA
ncbi:MAG TPA: TipAS antibiotic-recognition domain-containing protein [Candidatus Peribacteria bacterium]|nr:TipAS antibiotic-recognition domain-containing protein [Candidatus Peribacteria bacterium]